MQKTIWVAVADEAIVRFLVWPAPGRQLAPVEELTDAAAPAHGADLRRDAYGQRAGSATHASSPNTPHRLRSSASVTSSAGEGEQHLEAQAFARRVAAHLDEALRQKRFDELRIAAAPRFLGLLRQALSPHVAAEVTEELNKDLVQMDARGLTARFFPEPAAGGS